MRLVDKLLIVCFLLASQENVFTSGQVDPYIIGGKDAKYIPHPWMVSLYFGCFDNCEPQERCQHMTCGGTLISPQWVLTAAHCFEGTFENLHYFQVYVGDYDFMKDNERHEHHMAVEQIIKHDEYIHTTTKVENDIALIKLKEPVEETPETKCLRLAQNKNQLKNDCHLFGWGEASQDDGNACTKSHTLKSVDLNSVELDKCRGYYPNHTIYDKNVCAGGVEDQGACFGDSGGGLYCPMKNDDIYELLGIASWTMTNPCASPNKPTVFTDVTATDFRNWINKNCEHCLDNYNEKHCENSIHMRPLNPTTTPASGCPYPDSPPKGSYNCPGVNPGDLVDIDGVCYLVCENDHFAGSIVCKENGQFDKSDLNEDACSEEPTPTVPKVTTTLPTPDDSCPYPSPPLPGATYNCPPFNEDDAFISSGTACYLQCQDGTFAGSAVCMENGQFDESDLEKWKCYPATDCEKENRDYKWHDLNHVDDVETWMECGVLCQDQQRCTHWTLNVKHRKCYLKKGNNYGEPDWFDGAISGERDCP